MRSWLARLAATSAFAVPFAPSAARNVTIRSNAVAAPSGLTGDCPARIIAQKSNPLCKQHFTLSQDLTQCICATRKFTSLDGKTCGNNCPAGQFGGANNQCTPCSANVKTCRDANTALTCNSGYYLNKGTCVQKCPLSTYVDSTNTCRACADSDASSCKDGGANSATACTSSTDTHTAKQCAAGVQSCTCGDANCATACGKDSNGNQLFLNFDGTCVAQCAAGSYNDPHTDACLKCDSTALTCDATGALTCGKDSVGTQLYLTSTKKCIFAAAGVPAYYPDDATFTFKPCLDGVTSCVGSGSSDALTCGTRSDGATLFFNAPEQAPVLQRKIVSSKRLSQTSAPLAMPTRRAARAMDRDRLLLGAHTSSQRSFSDLTGVVFCSARGTYLSQSGDCLSADACKASGAFWPDSKNNVCSTCDAGEAACTGNGAGLATAWATNADGKQLYLFQGDCYTSNACPAATYPDNNSKACTACDAGALTCTGPHAALTCGTDSIGARLFLNINGDCVTASNCDSSTYADYATRKCESCSLIDPDAKTCTTPSLITCSCVDPCPTRMYGNTANHVCTPCADPDALTCDASGALSCNNLYLWQKSCQTGCPAGTYANGHICTPCTDTYGAGAATCDSTKTLSCNAGYVWEPFGGLCITEGACTSIYGGYYVSNGKCTACGDTWPHSDACTAAGPTSWNAFRCDQLTGLTTICLSDPAANLPNYRDARCTLRA
uniref:FGENESH: predicted gene_17.154 protein n=1 Tax=Rhodotorula toruloides TaxID=5286 RepID=A0A0K3CSD6_RHOTO